jgi:hypothetical protein
MKSSKLQLIGHACLYGASLSLLSACNSSGGDNPAAPQYSFSPMSTVKTSTGKIKKQKGVLSQQGQINSEQWVALKLSNGSAARIQPPACLFSSTSPSECHFTIRNISKQDPGWSLNAVVGDQVVASVALPTSTPKKNGATLADDPSDYTGPTADPVFHMGGEEHTYLAMPVVNNTGQTIQQFHIHTWVDSGGSDINGYNMSWQPGVELVHVQGDWYDVWKSDSYQWNYQAYGYIGGSYKTDDGESTDWTVGIIINGQCFSDHQSFTNVAQSNPLVALDDWAPFCSTDDEVCTNSEGFWSEFVPDSDHPGQYSWILYGGIETGVDPGGSPHGDVGVIRSNTRYGSSFDTDYSQTFHLSANDSGHCSGSTNPSPPQGFLMPTGTWLQTCWGTSWTPLQPNASIYTSPRYNL